MRKASKNLKAYTLIEALVVVAIIAIVTSIILVSYSNSRRTQQLEGAAREVEAAVREAQSYALTGYQGVVGTDPCRFEVAWSGTTYSVTYWYKSTSDDSCTGADPLVLGSYAVRNGVAFTSGGSFSYTPPYATASFDSNDGVVESRVVPLTFSGSFQAVCVYDNGLINNRTGASCP
jgi:prepilin-type N-terminal cleavage/methylation domain-containing protein